MDIKTFEGLGLTKGESKTYLALIELGETTAGPLVSKTQMQKTTVYLCLEKLMHKGLITQVIINKRKHFSSLPPDRILDYLEEKESEIASQKKLIRELMPKMAVPTGKSESCASFFSGWNGIKSAFDDILRTMIKGEEYCVFGVSSSADTIDRMRRFLNKFHDKRNDLGIKACLIINEDYRNTIGSDRIKEKLSKVRFVGKEFSTPAVINVYKNKTLIAIWNREPAAVLINNRETADSFRKYFELIWKIARV
ncbi:MAG: helix-turn-helix domain-containing protein [Candidatus Micrarchaeia archaeon]